VILVVTKNDLIFYFISLNKNKDQILYYFFIYLWWIKN